MHALQHRNTQPMHIVEKNPTGELGIQPGTSESIDYGVTTESSRCLVIGINESPLFQIFYLMVNCIKIYFQSVDFKLYIIRIYFKIYIINVMKPQCSTRLPQLIGRWQYDRIMRLALCSVNSIIFDFPIWSPTFLLNNYPIVLTWLGVPVAGLMNF